MTILETNVQGIYLPDAMSQIGIPLARDELEKLYSGNVCYEQTKEGSICFEI